MSQHKSLKTPGGGILKKRSVLKRWERIDELRRRGKYKDGDSIYNLPKTKPRN
jgi:small basic protein (TIGR04137 family)